MNQWLNRDDSDLENLLEQTLNAAVEYLGSLDARPPAAQFKPRELLQLPENGLGAQETLELFLERFGREMPASNGPRFWGFVTGGTTPAALMGDWLTSAYDLNLSSAANSTAPNIELEALSFLRELFGLPSTFQGVFVSGATVSNLTGLAIGREWVGQEQGVSIAGQGLGAVPPLTVFSGEPHSSVYKALAILGLGRSSLHPVALLPGNREAVDVAALENELNQLHGKPCIVVANAGTVNTVDFDDLQAIAELKSHYRFWLHVDAAFGGFAACSPAARHLLAGMAEADSLTIDAHKWLNVPYDSAMLFTRHRDLQTAVFQNSAAYLGPLSDPPDFLHLAPENSRRMRALPAWFTLLAYGKMGYQTIVEQNCAAARALGNRVQQADEFQLLAPVRLNVVCFTLAGDVTAEQIGQFLARLRDDGRVLLTPTVYKGTPGVRAAFSNWRTQLQDVETAWQAMMACL